MKRRILLLGAGKIGSLIACLLDESGGYEVDIGSLEFEPLADDGDGTGPSVITSYSIHYTKLYDAFHSPTPD